jgi:hypothetical protein
MLADIYQASCSSMVTAIQEPFTTMAYAPHMNAAAIGQLKSDLAALEECVERARLALGCRYVSAAEFESDNVAAWRARKAQHRRVVQARFALIATAISASALLLVILSGL